jgi:hypothetical protein
MCGRRETNRSSSDEDEPRREKLSSLAKAKCKKILRRKPQRYVAFGGSRRTGKVRESGRMSVNKNSEESVEKTLGKVLRQIDDCLTNLSDKDQLDFLMSLRVHAKSRLDEIEKAQLQMAIVEWAGRANQD